MFAITVQQSVAFVLGLIVVVGWLLWLVANVRRARPEIGAELELAANRKPLPSDEEMEGPRLDGVLRWALISLTIIAVGLPLYWLAEPGRQSGAIANFDETFAHRGEGLYAITAEGGFDCAGCHGGVSGGFVPYTLTDPVSGDIRQVQWWAPSLDDVTLRMSDDQIREVLVYGRPYSPMPAWGLEGGGPMNEQQIDNLVAYLHSVKISADEARERSSSAADEELDRLRNLESALADARSQLSGVDPADRKDLQDDIARMEAELELGQDDTMGAALFNLHCARCHTLGYSWREPAEPGSGAFGPPLYNVLKQFPLEEDHVDFVANGREFGERYGVQGKSSGRMPYFGQVLTEEQIQAIVDYERLLAERAGQQGEDQ
jgi:mono/diheme cytochrome c family protein